MSHSCWTFKPNRLSYALEILAVTTKAIVYSVTKFMNQGIQKLYGLIEFWGDKYLIHHVIGSLPWPTLT
jgi:hypothetical protein